MITRRLFIFAAIALAALATPAAAKDKKPAQKADPNALYATFKTSIGDIVVLLYEKDAPKTVANFVSLAKGEKEWKAPLNGQVQKNRPFYDGTSFHRVIPKFMIQGGDPNSNPEIGRVTEVGRGGPGYKFEDEFNNGHTFDKPGYLAMANSGPNTNGSQFFITEVATPHLNNKHTIFGEVISGQELVTKIVEAGNMNVQLMHVLISRGAPAK